MYWPIGLTIPGRSGARYSDEGADAVLMASITHFGYRTITRMKEYLRDRGLPMNP